MTPARFRKLYTGAVVQARPSAIDGLQIPKRTRDFLVEAGLPASLPELFQLEDLKRRKFLRMDQWPDLGEVPTRFADLCVIARVEERPICIEDGGYGYVSTLCPDGRQFELMNTDVSSLAVCMWMFARARDHQPPAWDECLRAIDQWDGTATARDGFWKRLLEGLVDEQASSAAPDDPVRQLRWTHPRLGLFRWDEDRRGWWGTLTPLRKLSQFGWNLERYRKAASPPSDSEGRPLPGQPPARFLPRPPRRKDSRGPIRIFIESRDKNPPGKRQQAAIDFLLDSEERIVERILKAVRQSVDRRGEEVRWMAEELGKAFSKLAPLLGDDEGWASLIDFTEVTVSRDGTGPCARLGYQGACAWDMEHGLGVQMAKDRVLRVGHSDVGWQFY